MIDIIKEEMGISRELWKIEVVANIRHKNKISVIKNNIAWNSQLISQCRIKVQKTREQFCKQTTLPKEKNNWEKIKLQ